MTTFDLLPLGQNINVLFSANTILGFCLIGFINAIIMALVAYRYFQVIQQCGYVSYEYKKWLLRRDNSHITRLAMLSQLSLLGFMLTNMAFMVFNSWWVSYCGFGLYSIFLFIYLSAEAKKKNKLPLVFTKRLVRLLLTFILITTIISVLVIFIVNGIALISPKNFLLLNFRYAILCVFPILTPFIVLLAYYINSPLENAINKKYVANATDKIKSYNFYIESLL